MTPESQDHRVLAATWIAKPGYEGRVEHILRSLAYETRREPGCVTYVVHQALGDPTHFLLYEVYRDAAAVQAHTDSAHFKQHVLVEAAPLLASRQRLELSVLTD